MHSTRQIDGFAFLPCAGYYFLYKRAVNITEAFTPTTKSVRGFVSNVIENVGIYD